MFAPDEQPSGGTAAEIPSVREFISVFAEGWRQPGGIDGFLRFFGPYLDPNVRLRGPLTPDCDGLAQFTEFFTLLFALIPDLHGEVERWEVLDEESARVWLTLRGTIGSRAVRMDLRDRLLVRRGRLVERAASGASLGALVPVLLTPGSWRRAARLFLRRGWSAPAAGS